MRSDLFFYDLPKSFIAQTPLAKRDHSKMMVLDKKSGHIIHDVFYNIIDYLDRGDVLVLNESMVTNCRIEAVKESTGAKIECFILKKTGKDIYQVLLKPSKRLKSGDRVIIKKGQFYYDIIEKQDYGKAEVRFNSSLEAIIGQYGKVPLPPYISNKNISSDRYQTIYAKTEGSAAAPTAGFHFTEQLIKKLEEKGIIFAKCCLDIGLDTFRPIVEKDIEEHVIHNERFNISSREASKILKAKEGGGRVIAVGTTSTRVLESVMQSKGRLGQSCWETSLYIYPGYDFKIVDAMITNFHLPYSTLLVMVSAFAGRENVLRAYDEAKSKNYRFYSFGDCMLII